MTHRDEDWKKIASFDTIHWLAYWARSSSVERLSYKHEVLGSSPSGPTIKKNKQIIQ